MTTQYIPADLSSLADLAPYEVTETEKRSYTDEGFFVAKGLVPTAAMAALADRLDLAARGELSPEILRQVEPAVAKSGVDSGDPLDYVRKVQRLAANDSFFKAFVSNPRILALIWGLFGEDIRYLGDEAQLKPARVGSAHPWHQDAPYFHREPMAVATIWLAVDPATRENGCMEVIPGAHKEGIIRRSDEKRPWFEDGEIEVAGAVFAEMDPGDGLVFDSLLPHGSGPNVSPKRRRSMICRYVKTVALSESQLDVVRKHGGLTGDSAAHPIFSLLP